MPPVTAFQPVTRRAEASSGGKTAWRTASVPSRPTPSNRPTTGNHHAARPSAETPGASRPGTGTTVRNRTARISDPMGRERWPRRSDGQDGIASQRELELLGFRVGETPDQLVAQLGAAHDAVDEHLGRQLVDVDVLRVLLPLLLDVGRPLGFRQLHDLV